MTKRSHFHDTYTWQITVCEAEAGLGNLFWIKVKHYYSGKLNLLQPLRRLLCALFVKSVPGCDAGGSASTRVVDLTVTHKQSAV